VPSQAIISCQIHDISDRRSGQRRVAIPCWYVTVLAAYQFFSIELGLSFVEFQREGYDLRLYLPFIFSENLKNAISSQLKAINAAEISVWFSQLSV